jgi:serine/threonine protein kinase
MADPTEQGSTDEPLPPTELVSRALPLTDEPTATFDLAGESQTTGFVPSFRVPVAPAAEPKFPAAGEHLGDFELVSVLGKGAFATVYLARQVSLGRQVALKVSANRGTEARTLASLEHDHIVTVFSEDTDPAANLRLLCMQYVNGPTLERVLKYLSERPRQTWSGALILEAIDALSSQPAMFDPAALRDRELLGGSDYFEALCWQGARLAEALAHAHGQQVLHRDIKPANILLNRYGRPLLADFNISLDRERVRGATGSMFGGTLNYMAPEHIDAFNPAEKSTTAEAVDERSDIYSFGVVLFESLTGQLPFEPARKGQRPTELLRSLAAGRRAESPAPSRLTAVPEVLDWTVRRCLDPVPAQRFQSGSDLAHALEGCREHRQVGKEMPPAGPITRAVLHRPLLIGFGLTVLPHLIASVVNITYNSSRIMDELSPEQQRTFDLLVLAYNAIVYPFCLFLLWRVMAPIGRAWRALGGQSVPSAAAVAEGRRQVLKLPTWAIILACIGWLPGGVLFPLAIHFLTGPISPEIFGHFLVSFTISGLIALTYSLFAVQFLVLRVLYPRLWIDAYHMRHQAAAELGPLSRRLRWFPLLAGLIPLAVAFLMVGAPEWFRQTLIALGAFGFSTAFSFRSYLQQVLMVLTGK